MCEIVLVEMQQTEIWGHVSHISIPIVWAISEKNTRKTATAEDANLNLVMSAKNGDTLPDCGQFQFSRKAWQKEEKRAMRVFTKLAIK